MLFGWWCYGYSNFSSNSNKVVRIVIITIVIFTRIAQKVIIVIKVIIVGIVAVGGRIIVVIQDKTSCQAFARHSG